eukprot:191155-Amphidinium_carterae.4
MDQLPPVPSSGSATPLPDQAMEVIVNPQLSRASSESSYRTAVQTFKRERSDSHHTDLDRDVRARIELPAEDEDMQLLTLLCDVFPEQVQHYFEQQNSHNTAHLNSKDSELPRVAEVTAEAKVIYKGEVENGMDTELQAFMKHGVFARTWLPARNVIDARWVLKWKWQAKPGQPPERFCRARLCLRGFKDTQKEELDKYANTAGRISQRIICSMASLFKWQLVSIDISTAFLQGNEYTDPSRVLHLRADKDLADQLRKYPGYADFDENTECLRLLKSAYGLCDAPKRWFDALTETLRASGWMPLLADPAAYYHRDQHGHLDGVVSLHVDDLKLAAEEGTRKQLLQQLTQKYGKLKVNDFYFEHCGLMHEQESDFTIRLHQNPYLDSITEPSADALRRAKQHPQAALGKEDYKTFRTLLGQLSWLVQSRPEAAVTTSCLQSVANNPTGDSLQQAVLLLRWLKRHRVNMYFPAFAGPVRLVLFTDAAFKPEDLSKPVARRGDIL